MLDDEAIESNPLPAAYRPLTPDESDGLDHIHSPSPPTPRSIAYNPPSPQPPRDGDAAPASPPVRLVQKTWAKPQPLAINKVRLKEPRGIQEVSNANTSKWPGALRRIGDVYTYSRIASNQVRLLLIKPGIFEDDIYVSLITVIDEQLGSETYPYCALSYHWGEGQFNHTVFVQEDATSRTLRTMEDVVDAKRPKKLKIKPNLADALKHLRDETDLVSVWIDALCINQFDEDEKNEQVMKMALIYSNAYNVNIWLGSDHGDSPVSDLAMAFISKINDPKSLDKILKENSYIKNWASLFELLKWSWFSRRWVIQELALSQHATVHCGKYACLWGDFQAAISTFYRYFNILKPKLIHHFEATQPDRWSWNDDSVFEIEQLGAKLLVDMTSNLFRHRKNGSRESTKGLETLVCSLSGFDTSDPRDTINALRNISKELNRPDSLAAKSVPAPCYGKDLFEVYRDFVRWAVKTSDSLDILCRFWALKERKTLMPTTPRLVDLPSWIQFVEDSAWGKGADLFNGRQAGDSFVGLPDDHCYYASGQGFTYKHPVVTFPSSQVRDEHTGATPSILSPAVDHDTSLLVRGLSIGTISFRTDPFPDGIITKECLERLGWSFDRYASIVPDVPDQLWQTLVADRGPKGTSMPTWYKKACQQVLAYQSNNGHINIDKILRRSNTNRQQSMGQEYLERVKAVTWNRSFIEGHPCQGQDQLVGFAPPKTEVGDVIAILFGCSVPVILRPTYNTSDDVDEYQFVGEAYIYGKMDGEAFDECYQEQGFRLV